jgi:thiol-activated cytolysin
MASTRWSLAAVSLAAAFLLMGCASSDDPPPPAPPTQSVLEQLPAWSGFSPPVDPLPPTKTGPSESEEETIRNVPVLDPVSGALLGYRDEMYECTTTRYSMRDTPDKIAMFSPDVELLWPGALLQGRSHRDGLGSLVGLPIRERTPIKVSIPALATEDNFRLVEAPDLASVNQAIGSMVRSATTTDLATPSTIQFTLDDFSSEESFALKAGMSGRYLGFSMSASGSVDQSARERTVMVYFHEKMFEVVVEPPQTPGAFFSDAFTQQKLDEQVALGRIGRDNPPLYVSNIVYGRTMAFTLTSSASASAIKAALNAAYKGIFSAGVSLSAEHKKLLEEARLSVTSLGGQSKASVAMIASGDWHQYFTEAAPLTSAAPLSYTFRSVRDGAIASVAESTEYAVRECNLKASAFSGFLLESFESADALSAWNATSPVSLGWGAAESVESIFYGYAEATHVNEVSASLCSVTRTSTCTVDADCPVNERCENADFLYAVGYLQAPDAFEGDKLDFHQGEISFWYKPDKAIRSTHSFQMRYRVCVFPSIFGCLAWAWVDEPVTVEAIEPVRPEDEVYAWDEATRFDQVVLRGGSAPYAVSTITYNPPGQAIAKNWSKFTIGLTNDPGSNSLCGPPAKPGCWLIEDEVATEQEIRYVLGNLLEMRLRLSYPVYRRQGGTCSATVTRICGADAECPGGEICDRPLAPFGYVAGYLDEVKLSKRVAP